ncbi:MAG: helix-turn-helix domain-containing protein, partial [Bacteroidota bacterium]
VIWKINEGETRFKLLKKVLPGVSDKMLSETISELETDGILQKNIFREVPLRVEYELTPFGEELIPVLKAMDIWGTKTLKKIQKG